MLHVLHQGTIQVSVRLPPALVARLDGHARRLWARSGGLKVSRADAVRALLTEGLRRAEARDPVR